MALSITSSWGNGHATTYCVLVRELVARGHDVLFLERDVRWYAGNRDLPKPPFGGTRSIQEARDRFSRQVQQADVVIARSDIFSFGALLYEMLTGRPAFRRDSNSESLAAILRDDPEPLSRVAPSVAPT